MNGSQPNVVVVAAEATGLFESEAAFFYFRRYKKKHIRGLITFFAYFPKMKVGLSNHQSVCVCVCLRLCVCLSVSVSPTNNF
jgi:hypothetical protein